MHEYILVLSICCGNPFKAPISMEEISVWRKNKQPPSSVPSWQKTSTLLPEDQDAPFKSSPFHFLYSLLELAINSTGTRCLPKASHLLICCCEIV